MNYSDSSRDVSFGVGKYKIHTPKSPLIRGDLSLGIPSIKRGRGVLSYPVGIFLWGAFLSAVAQLYAEVPPFNHDKYLTLIKDHKEFYLGKKEPDPGAWAVFKDGRLNATRGGDKLSWHLEHIFEPVGKLDKVPQADNVLLEKIIAETRAQYQSDLEKLTKLESAVNECGNEIKTIIKFLNEPDPRDQRLAEISRNYRKNIKPKAFTLQQNELFYSLNQFTTQVINKNKQAAVCWGNEVLSLFKRLNSINKWMGLQIQWMQESIDLIEELLKTHPDACRTVIGRNLPGVYFVMFRFRDIAELQRQVEDILMLSMDEQSRLGKPASFESDYLVAPGVRKLYGELMSGLKGENILTGLIQNRLADDYDNTYLNYLFWKYQDEKITDKLIVVLKKWLSKHRDQDISRMRIGLMEVMNYRQGALEAGENPTDRFHPKIWAEIDKIQGTPGECFHQAQQIMLDWYKEMSYAGTSSIKEAFEKKKGDCYRNSNIIGCLMANAGYDSIYPIRGPGNHQTISFRINDTYVVREGLFPFWTVFPDYSSGKMSKERTKEELDSLFGGDYFGERLLGRHRLTDEPTNSFSRWCRTVASFVDAEILIGGEPPKLIRREIPYYGQKKEVIEIK